MTVGIVVDLVALVCFVFGLFLCTRDALRKTTPTPVRVSSTVAIVVSIPAVVFVIASLLVMQVETGQYRIPEISCPNP